MGRARLGCTSMEYEAKGNGKAESTGSLESKLKEMETGANEQIMNQLKPEGDWNGGGRA
jgi:hypothetical protein